MAGIANFNGEIENFDIDADRSTLATRWAEWKSAVNYMIKAKGITTPGQKEAVLLHTGGRNLQKVYETLPEPTDVPEESTCFDIALAKLDRYFAGKINAPYERHKFRKMRQESSETVSRFVARLKRQGEFCSFGANINTQVRDQLIDGCLSTRLRKNFLEKGNELTLEKAIDMANSFEAVHQQANEMDLSVNKVDVMKKRNDRSQNPKKQKASTDKSTCWRCGKEGHFARDEKCPAKGKECRLCKKVGHFAVVCKTKDKKFGEKGASMQRNRKGNNNVFGLREDFDDDSEEEVFTVNLTGEDDPSVTIKVGGQLVKVLVDSGASCNVLDEGVFEKLKQNRINYTSEKISKFLKPYATTNRLEVSERMFTNVEVAGKKLENIEFLIIKGKARSLLGRKTAMQLGVLEINVPQVNMVEEEFDDLFSGKVGKLKDYQVELHVKPDVPLVAQSCRRIPYSMRPVLEKKLKELEELDIIERVEGPTPCVSPIVIVNKPDGDIRVCVDMRQANTAIERSRHPIPTVDEVLSDLNGYKVFSKLDLKMGYHQLELKEGISRHLTTFTTHVGLFRYKRLMFGISSAPEIYQHIIQQVLEGGGCSGSRNISDDIVVGGKDVADHDVKLRKVLQTLHEKGLTLNKEKCVFRLSEIEFMGHLLSKRGVGPTESRVRALMEATEPKDSAEVRSFLGLVNFSARYIPNLATRSEPLRRLTQKNTLFVWGEEQKKCFQDLKNSLVEHSKLAYYDPEATTKVVADASPVGLGAVLLQSKEKGDWRPVSYASRSLSDTERRYSQTEKEALALVWATERFHMYLYGKEFELETDHKPLEAIYSVKSKPSARIERWVLRLLPYHFWVTYRPGKQNIADALSRMTQNKDETSFDDTDEYVNFVSVKAVPKAMTSEMVEKASEEDEEIIELRECIQTGNWDKSKCTEYLVVANELCVVGNIVMRGTRLVIPKCLRQGVLSIGHEGHPGIVSMKQRLRTKVWWPKMDKDVLKFVKSCPGCQMVSQPNPPEPVASTELPQGPWQAIAVDFLGPLPSNDFIFVAVDYYSRYYEADILRTVTAEKTIVSLEKMFASHGLPELMVSDNGPQFISQELKEFLDVNGIKHRKVTPKWAQANGEVERQNKSILKRLKIAQIEGKDWKRELVRYLAAYRTTPHQTTGRTPAEMLMGRQLRTKLPQLSESVKGDEEVRDRDQLNKMKSKLYADKRRNAKLCDVKSGDLVLKKKDKVNKLSPTFETKLYKVVERNGTRVLIADCQDEKRQLLRNITDIKQFNQNSEDRQETGNNAELSKFISESGQEHSEDSKESKTCVPEVVPDPKTQSSSNEVPKSFQRPQRVRKLPEKLKDYVLT